MVCVCICVRLHSFSYNAHWPLSQIQHGEMVQPVAQSKIYTCLFDVVIVVVALIIDWPVSLFHWIFDATNNLFFFSAVMSSDEKTSTAYNLESVNFNTHQSHFIQ